MNTFDDKLQPDPFDRFFVFIGILIVLAIGARVAMGADRRFCTWDISYYLLGEKHRSVSTHGWLFTEKEELEMFGPFKAGHIYVEPGKAKYTCGTTTYHLITQPAPGGSFLLLGK